MLEKKEVTQEQRDLIDQAVILVNQIIMMVDKFENCRQGEKVLTKLEECVMWFQMLVTNIPQKKSEEKVSDKKKKK